MIYGVGMDIVQVSRLEQGLRRFGERLARRILADCEWGDFESAKHKPYFLAKHFAAKEAMAKALGTGFRDGVSLRQIGVRHDDKGRPFLTCEGRARQCLEYHGISHSHLSLTDERDYAAAVVILERG